MNGINSIRLDFNTARYESVAARKKVPLLAELKITTEADKKKQFKTELSNEFNSRKKQSNSHSELILSDRKYYRSSLLGEIYNKMSGVDDHINPGHYVEYYA